MTYERSRSSTGIRRNQVRRVSPIVAIIVAIGLGAALAFVSPAVASAHAYYVSSDPTANAVLKAAPTTMTIHFAEAVNPTGSDVIVYDARHKPVSTAPAHVDRADLKTMTVSMRGDGSGVYLVEWHTVSALDGDPDIGAFTFSVNPNGGSASSSPTASPAAASGSAAGGTSGGAGTPGWVVALVGVLGLVIGAGGTLVARRSR